MPLFEGKSKKSFKKNVETEMKSGKPKDQSLAIAVNIQRKNRKKMALGGAVEPVDRSGHPYSRTPATPAPKPDDKRRAKDAYAADGWAGAPELDDEASTSMGPAKDEYMASRFADGGEVEESPEVKAAAKQEQDDIERGIDERMKARQEGGSPGYARGGQVHPMDLMSDDERATSIADAILAKRRKMAEGGMVDLEDSNQEDGDPSYDDQNTLAAAKKEVYDDDQISSQPRGSNLKGDSREDDSENHMDMVSAIRAKLRAKRS